MFYIPNPLSDFSMGGCYAPASTIEEFEDTVVRGTPALISDVRPPFIASFAYSLIHDSDVAVTAYPHLVIREVFGKGSYPHWRGLGDRLGGRTSILKLSEKTGAGVPQRPGVLTERDVKIDYMEPDQPQQPINPNEWEMVPVSGNMVEFRPRRLGPQ